MILDDIVLATRQATAARKQHIPLEQIRSLAEKRPAPPDFAAAIDGDGVSIIAEVKRASPSRGVICQEFAPTTIARAYATSGAAAISVLTEEKYFLGSPTYLKEIAEELGPGRPPLLRKDFILDPYQVYEARAWGASALLLIAAILTSQQLNQLTELARQLGMIAMVEVHREDEINRALCSGTRVIGINNRNLQTLEVDINITGKLRPLIPGDRLVVSESGISSSGDIRYLRECGVDAALVGEALMTGSKIESLIMNI